MGVNRTVDAVEDLLLHSLGIGLLASLFLGYIIARSLTRPLADISNAACRFSQGNFNSRTKVTGSDEICRLGTTFNNMAESLAYIDQNRREFLANVTHELKTPVTCIQALSEAIIDGMVVSPDQQKNYLSTIISESKRIDRLIHDLLDLAQLDAGELFINSQPLNLASFLLEEKDNYLPLIAEKQLQLKLELPANLPQVSADPDRLSQVIANLVSNAVRYAFKNTVITIQVQVKSHFLEVSVIDFGSGIPPESLPFIWDRFYRVDKARTKDTGGSGLGLSITKKLVEAMGGSIGS